MKKNGKGKKIRGNWLNSGRKKESGESMFLENFQTESWLSCLLVSTSSQETLQASCWTINDYRNLSSHQNQTVLKLPIIQPLAFKREFHAIIYLFRKIIPHILLGISMTLIFTYICTLLPFSHLMCLHEWLQAYSKFPLHLCTLW